MDRRDFIPLAAWSRVALFAGLVCLATTRALAQGGATVSFQRDIAPIVADHCTSCHREAGDAPFSLTTAGAVAARAATIAAVVSSR
jgi:hypothetical protein